MPLVSCTTYNTDQAAQNAAIASAAANAIITDCAATMDCIVAQPLGALGVFGTTQVLGKDGNFHVLPVPLTVTAAAFDTAGVLTLTLSDGATITAAIPTC